MKLRDLLKSDFKHYEFVCPASDFEFGSEIRFKKTKGDITYEWLIKLDKYSNDRKINYDLSYCVARDNHCTCVDWVVKIIEMSKQFEFDYLEHSNDTLVIHLRRK